MKEIFSVCRVGEVGQCHFQPFVESKDLTPEGGKVYTKYSQQLKKKEEYLVIYKFIIKFSLIVINCFSTDRHAEV